jgi:hypothetical protein
MDLFTLTAVVLVFLLCLGLYLATTAPPPPPPPPPVRPRPPFLSVYPAVLRQNVAVGRLMR